MFGNLTLNRPHGRVHINGSNALGARFPPHLRGRKEFQNEERVLEILGGGQKAHSGCYAPHPDFLELAGFRSF